MRTSWLRNPPGLVGGFVGYEARYEFVCCAAAGCTTTPEKGPLKK